MQLDPTSALVAATLAAIAEALDLITAETWRRADDLAAGLRLTSERDGARRLNPRDNRATRTAKVRRSFGTRE